MKKIYKSLFIAMIAAAGLTACSDYEAPDITTGPAISIVSRSTDFPAAASTGVIKFKADGPVTVTSANDWITASVEGDEINVAVTQNNSIDGRAGSIIVKSGDAEDEISIIQSGLIFKYDEIGTIDIEADAWSHDYKADASLPIEVTSDAEWLKGSVSEGVLTISADRNTKLQGRTGVITIKVGDLTDEITVNQGPLTFPLIKVTKISQNDDAKTYTYEFPSDVEVTFTSDVAWLHGSFANETVTVTVDANNEGHIRSGKLSYSLEGAEGSITVEQYEFDKDIAGEYQWLFTDPSDNQDYYYRAELKRNGNDYSLDFILGRYQLSAPVTWNDKTRTLNLAGGTYVGKWSSYFAYVCYSFYDPEDGKTYFTWSDEPSMNASFVYFEQSGYGVTGAAFTDAKTFDYDLINLQINAFSAQPPSSSTSKGYITKMVDPMLMRMQALSSENTSATPFKATTLTKAATRRAKAKPAPGVSLKQDTSILAR